MIKRLVLKFKVAMVKRDMRNTKRKENVTACSFVTSKKVFEFAKADFINEEEVYFQGNEKQIKNFLKDIYNIDGLKDGSVVLSKRGNYTETKDGIKFIRKRYAIKPELL